MTASGDEGRAGTAAPLVSAGLLLLYAVLTPLHVLSLSGTARTVMPLVSSASAALLLVLLVRWRRRPPTWPVLESLAVVPLVNCLVHLGTTGDVQQTTTLMLAVVAVGFGVTSRRAAAALVLGSCAAWVALVPQVPDGSRDLVVHHAFQLAMAVLMAGLVHEVRRRREAVLSAARDALALDVGERRRAERRLADSEANLAAVSQVVRRIRTGEDARASIVGAAMRIAAASSATLLEPDGSDLVVTCSEGLSVSGLRVPLDSTSATAHVFRTGRPVFLAQAAHSPLVDPALLELSGARAMLWQPVLSRERVTAVLALTWREPVEQLSDQAEQAVRLLADETAVALEHDQLLARYAHLATTDALTGLPNRRAWDERLPSLMADAARHGKPLLVAVLDLDRFKSYNDSRGHVEGDALLRETARRLREQLRGVDLVARWGGEEFVLALPECDAADAQAVLDRLRAAIPDGQTCSVGVALWDGAESPQDVVRRADAALYLAKESGRDRVVAAV